MRALSLSVIVWLASGVPSVAFALDGNGTPCTSEVTCASGYCVDGVCCEVNCGAGSRDCQVCSVALGATADGTCTGLPAGVPCGPEPTCTDGLLTPAQTCDGFTVNCETALVIGCYPYVCDPTACRTTCTSSSQCAAGFRCIGQSCFEQIDLGFFDAGNDAGPPDGGRDASVDSARIDGGVDASARDAATSPDATTSIDGSIRLDASVTPSPARGCGCAIPAARDRSAIPIVLAIAVALARRRRRRQTA